MRQAKVGGGRFIGNLGGPELLADLERVQLWDGAGDSRSRCRCRRTTCTHTRTCTLHWAFSHERRATSSRPTPGLEAAQAPEPAEEDSRQGVGTGFRSSLPPPQAASSKPSCQPCLLPSPLRLPTPGHRLRSSILSPARLPNLMALSQPSPLSSTAHRPTTRLCCRSLYCATLHCSALPWPAMPTTIGIRKASFSPFWIRFQFHCCPGGRDPPSSGFSTTCNCLQLRPPAPASTSASVGLSTSASNSASTVPRASTFFDAIAPSNPGGVTAPAFPSTPTTLALGRDFSFCSYYLRGTFMNLS